MFARYLLIFAAAASLTGCKVSPKTSSQAEGVWVQHCPAPQVERRLWKKLFKNYVAIKLLDNYMDCSGAAMKLTRQEMIDLHARLNILDSAAARAISESATFPEVDQVFHTAAFAYGGTLGQFDAIFNGHFERKNDGGWVFHGTVKYDDLWDFDPLPKGVRSANGEFKTDVAYEILSGVPFHVFSESLDVIQENGAQFTTLMGPPATVGDPDYSELGRLLGTSPFSKKSAPVP